MKSKQIILTVVLTATGVMVAGAFLRAFENTKWAQYITDGFDL
jgi:hypothetical protein